LVELRPRRDHANHVVSKKEREEGEKALPSYLLILFFFRPFSTISLWGILGGGKGKKGKKRKRRGERKGEPAWRSHTPVYYSLCLFYLHHSGDDHKGEISSCGGRQRRERGR